jgi:hypothetical protein
VDRVKYQDAVLDARLDGCGLWGDRNQVHLGVSKSKPLNFRLGAVLVAGVDNVVLMCRAVEC